MKRYIYLLVVTCLFGCSDWLNVQPSDRVAEESAFSTIAGFKQALNGVYVDLNATELYGQTLTCEMLEILAPVTRKSSNASPKNSATTSVK